MNVKVTETKENTFKDSNIDGILFNIWMQHATVNTAFVASDFAPENIIVKVILYRNKEEITVVQNNLKILGRYASMVKGSYAWERGNVLTYPAGGVDSTKLYSLRLDFGGIINVKGDDELYIEVTCGANAFSANVDTGVSFVEFNPSYGIGYELGTPQIKSKVVQSAESSQKFSIGDNCLKLAFINFDKDAISAASQIIVTASLTSEQLQMSLNFFDLLNRHWNLVDRQIPYRYGNTQPVTAGNEAFPYVPVNPQSVIIHCGEFTMDVQTDLDNTTLDLSLNSANVNASQNYVVSTTLRPTKQLISKAAARKDKHTAEKTATMISA